MTKREIISRLIQDYFRDTNEMKITVAEAADLCANSGIDVAYTYLVKILSLDAKIGMLYSVKQGEYMLGHRGSYHND